VGPDGPRGRVGRTVGGDALLSAPEVSVLLPVRDAGTTLDAAIASIRRQDGIGWECVAVDDRSTDGSRESLLRHAAVDPRIRVVDGPGRGIVAALRAGLDACRGAVVARMDADDLMRRGRLAAQCAKLAQDRSVDAVGSFVRLFPRAALGAGWRAYERWLGSIESPEDVAREAFVECPIVHPTLAIRAAVLRELSWRDRPWPEDYDLILRLLACGRRAAVVPRRLLAWRRGPGRLSERDPRYRDDAFARCKAHFLVRGVLRDAPTFRLWGYGHTGRALARALAAEGRRPDLIVDVHPGRLGADVAGAAVVPPERVGPPGGPPVLASVAGERPRGEIRRFLRERGFLEGRDFVCVA